MRANRHGSDRARVLGAAAGLGACIACATPDHAAGVRAPAAASPHTRYQVGDRVEYHYSGAFTSAPVRLTETVIAQEGERLRIDVEVARGADLRRFAQVLTDTPENEKNNVVDALYELGAGAPVALDPQRDLLRVYEWTFIRPDGKATDVKTARCEETIAGRAYACTCRTGRNVWRGRPLRFETSECPEFLWTHGPSRFWDDATGADVLRVEVAAVSRESIAPAPLRP